MTSWFPLLNIVYVCHRDPNAGDYFQEPPARSGRAQFQESRPTYPLLAQCLLQSSRPGCVTAGSDLRHTFVSRLAENASVSEQTIRLLAGHVSRQMLEHYSHIRSHAKQAAIRSLEEQSGTPVSEEAGHSLPVSTSKLSRFRVLGQLGASDVR